MDPDRAADQEELYDEFGNYLGPDLQNQEEAAESDSDQEDLESQIRESNAQMVPRDQEMNEEYYRRGRQVVLNEDKNYYPDAEAVFGEGVEAKVEEEDHQPITQPIIEPPKTKFNQVFRREEPELKYSTSYMVQVMSRPQLIRNVAILGALHHGKTLLSDMLIESTLAGDKKATNKNKPQRYTDSRVDEIDKEISVKAAPFQVLLEDLRKKNYAFNVIDTPGHPDFKDEIAASLRLADNALIVVDVLEGVTAYTEILIKMALKTEKKMVFCLNKLDRLVLELKLPPNDGYLKIKAVLDEVNITIQ
mmetsp:Transcript_3345/g.5578  ORF Transcript_3345/g.5578 Transcript_3345/m.5578 type:complete len:305 (-) Transcript_3345:2173-3087(-)